MEPGRQALPLENASILSEGALQDGHRLWIGNLDPKITESFYLFFCLPASPSFPGKCLCALGCPCTGTVGTGKGYHLLKLLQKFGKVKQFDFLFHKSGALEGQPRGYCFVNFETKQQGGAARQIKSGYWESFEGLVCLWSCLPVQEAEKAIQCLNGKLALSKKLVVRWAHAQVKRYDHNKNEKILPISLEPSSSTEPPQSNLSVSAKIKAIEAKLKMMAENPDAEYPAAPVYSYFKPPDKKRTTPYSRAAWKSRR
ncbi:hypothetical protein Nmel_017143 [Mimus melanotis]